MQGYFALVHDITERKRTERELQESKERLRLLLETTHAIPWEADAKTWRFTYVGPQVSTLLGYPPDQWYADDFWVDHLHPEDRADAMDFCLHASSRCQNYAFEYRLVPADGRITVCTTSSLSSRLTAYPQSTGVFCSTSPHASRQSSR